MQQSIIPLNVLTKTYLLINLAILLTLRLNDITFALLFL